jgi:hypothetical protein
MNLGSGQTVTGTKTFSVSPVVPDLAAGDNSTKAANSKYVDAGLATKAATVHTHAQSDITNLVTDLGLKAPLASPAFTGTASFGAVTVTGDITSGQNFISSTAISILAATGAGTVYLRPNGAASSVGQFSNDSTGNAKIGNALTVGPTSFLATNVNTGLILEGNGGIHVKRSGTAAQNNILFYNNAAVTPATVGIISTSGSATTYSTSSDEALKDAITPFSAEAAIDIIRADPPQQWVWKDGNSGVGWVAQKSHAVHPDLATHIPATRGDKSTNTEAQPEWWGIDYGRRTPYLWAALAAALDRIDDLETRLAAVEGA